MLATSITSTVLANILQTWDKCQLNTSKNVCNTILERMMYILSNTKAFLHNQTHLQVCFRRTCETTGNTWASCCFPKKRIGSNHDNVWHEHIFGQVTLIFIVLLFVVLINMKAAVNFKHCFFLFIDEKLNTC